MGGSNCIFFKKNLISKNVRKPIGNRKCKYALIVIRRFYLTFYRYYNKHQKGQIRLDQIVQSTFWL